MSQERQTIIDRIAKEVKNRLEGDGSGHDWWHIVRVWNMAKRIGAQERADMFVVELAALLHDIADWKFNDGDDSVGPRIAGEILTEQNVDTVSILKVQEIISTMSYSKSVGTKKGMQTLEGKIVQDADRLDALGAIGIARAFAYGGYKGQVMYDPQEKPLMHQTKESYRQSRRSTVNHFYEKLLLLKDKMNTKTAQEIAQGRHKVLEEYVKVFLLEWDGNDRYTI
jgi:uncharacterized protein